MASKSIIDQFLSKYFPDCIAACITGSYVDGNYNQTSDIDLWLITNKRDYFFKETILFKKHQIQVAHFSMDKISDILWADYITNRGLHIAAFAKARIVKDNEKYLQNVIVKCRELFKLGPQYLTSTELNRKKLKLLDALSDLKGCQSADEAYLIIAELLHHFISFYNVHNRMWDFGGKHAMRQFKKHNPKLAEMIIGGYQHFFIANDPGLFLKAVTHFTNLIGENEYGDSAHSGAIHIKTDYLVFQFAKADPYDFVKNKYPVIQEILMSKAVRTVFFESRPIGEAAFSNRSIYVVAFFKSSVDNNDKTINLYYQQIKNVIKEKTFSFPINLDLGLLFGSIKVMNAVSLLLEELSNWSSEKISNASESLKGAIVLFKNIRQALFDNDDDYVSFLEYLYENWIVKSYDTGKLYGIDQILSTKNDIETIFLNQYNQQKNGIEKIYESTGDLFENFLEVKKQFAKVKKVHALFFANPNAIADPTMTLSWSLYKNLAEVCLGTFLIGEEKKAYIPFIVKKVFEKSKTVVLQ